MEGKIEPPYKIKTREPAHTNKVSAGKSFPSEFSAGIFL